jgi:hypothetical protein
MSDQIEVVYGSICQKCFSTLVRIGDESAECMNDECDQWGAYYAQRRPEREAVSHARS